MGRPPLNPGSTLAGCSRVTAGWSSPLAEFPPPLGNLSASMRISLETREGAKLAKHSLPNRKHRARVVAAEAEGVVEGDFHGPVDGLVGGDVDVTGGILLGEVDGGRHNAVDHAEDGGDGLDGAGGSQ
jgi:hypothetical protein